MRRLFVPLLMLTAVLVPVQAQADEFVERVRAAFAAQAPDIHVTPLPNDELKIVGKSSMNALLDELRTSCNDDPAGCDAQIRRFVRITATAAREDSTANATTAQVYPVLRPVQLVEEYGKIAGGDPKKMVAAQPFLPGAALMYVFDSPDKVRYALLADIERLKISPDQLHEAALKNVLKLEELPVEQLRQVPGVYAAQSSDALGSSRIFDPRFWDGLEKVVGGPVAVATPARDWIIAARLDNFSAMAALSDLAGKMYQGEAYAVSPTLFRRVEGGWQEVRP